jgi:lipopolysaccharide transport protein LptA
MHNFAVSSICALLWLPSVAAAQLNDDNPAPISLDAESSTLDRGSNSMSFTKLHIQQGPLSIRADDASASGLDFERSEWSFRGNVVVRLDTAVLTADSAEFVFQNHVLDSARLQGRPATLEAIDVARDAPVRGGADELWYDRAAGSLRLSGTAWLTEGQSEMRGCDLVYDVNEQRVTVGTSACGEPVRITILPPPTAESSTPP